jgi:signal transduction histidine kinase
MMSSPRLPEDVERLLHDLRGPLNALTMHAEVLKRSVADDPTAASSVRTIQAEAERMADMLGAAMSIVALERGVVERVNLRAILEEARAEVKAEGLVVHDGEWPDVVGDRRLLVLAVAEILRNAVEATAVAGTGTPPPEASASIGDHGLVGVSVRDHGAGLRSTNPKVIIRLRSSGKPGHQGVGLLRVERIARLHGGSVRFEAPGPGARVTLLVSTVERS